MVELKNCGHDFVVTHSPQLKKIIKDFVENKGKVEESDSSSPLSKVKEARKIPKIANKIAIGGGLLALGVIASLLFKNKYRR